jgi:hypothetical protein
MKGHERLSGANLWIGLFLYLLVFVPGLLISHSVEARVKHLGLLGFLLQILAICAYVGIVYLIGLSLGRRIFKATDEGGTRRE